MTATLREVRAANPFARIRDFDAAAEFHVWHRRLGVANPADGAVSAALGNGRGIAVIGPSGSGKTSTLAAAALGTDGVAVTHLPLAISVSGADVALQAHDPRYIAERIVRAAAQVNEEARRLVDDATTSGTATRAARTWRAQLRIPGACDISRELRQRTEAVNFQRTPGEVISAASAALDVFGNHGLRPVLVLEDADGLLRLPNQSPQARHDIANAFFADGLKPLVQQLAVPVLLAVQPEYLTLDGFRAVAELLDQTVTVPTPSEFTDSGVRLLLAELLTTARVDRAIGHLFADDAMTVLVHNRYSMKTVRELLQACDRSLVQAISRHAAEVEVTDVVYALTQE